MAALYVMGALLATAGAAWGVLLGVSRRNERRNGYEGRHAPRERHDE